MPPSTASLSERVQPLFGPRDRTWINCAHQGPLPLAAVAAIERATALKTSPSALLDPAWFGAGAVHEIVAWLHAEGPNPFSCAAMGEFVGITTTVVVSKLTRSLPAAHIDTLFQSPQPSASD